MRILFLLFFSLSVFANDFPTIGNRAEWEFVTEAGVKQNWAYEVTDSELRLFSAKVFFSDPQTSTVDSLVGSTPYYSRQLNSSASDRNCAAEVPHYPAGATAKREQLLAMGKTWTTCHVHYVEDDVTYDAWIGFVPFGRLKFKTSGGRLPGRYMVEPGEAMMTSYSFSP